MEETTPLVAHPTLASDIQNSGHPHRRRATTAIFLITALGTFSSYMMGPAQARIFETIYCVKWYRIHDPSIINHGKVEEHYCKVPLVQSEIASLFGWKSLFEAIPGLFLAIPAGILADKFGRKWLVLACSISSFCRTCFTVAISLLSDTVDPKFVWLGGLFNLMSGGDLVAGVLGSVVLTDITPREELSKVFIYIIALVVVCFMLGTLIGASLMKIDDWIPIWTGLVIQLLFALCTLLLPETLRTINKTESQTTSRLVNGNAENPGNVSDAPQAHDLNQSRKLFSSSLNDFRRIFVDGRIAFLACLLPTRQLSLALEGLQARYISHRYNWTIANATYLYSLQALGALIVLLLILPRFSDIVQHRWDLTPIQSAALLGQISMGFSTLGTAIEGTAPTANILVIGSMIQTLAIGSPAAFRALAGSLVEPEDTSKIFTGLAIIETLSGMAAGPIVASIYNVGIQRGSGAWLGLPWDLTALAKGVLTVMMCMITFER